MPRATTRKADRKPTFTSVVLDVLIEADDFCSMSTIHSMAMSPSRGLPPEKVTLHVIEVTLQHLHRNRAVDSVVGGDGKLWWFATPDNDRRPYTVGIRKHEEVGSRGGRVKGPPPPLVTGPSPQDEMRSLIDKALIEYDRKKGKK